MPLEDSLNFAFWELLAGVFANLVYMELLNFVLI